MTDCTQESFQFPRVKGRAVEASFTGGEITSDGGVLLLRQADRLLGLSEAITLALKEPRRQAWGEHKLLGLVRQRLYALVWAMKI